MQKISAAKRKVSLLAAIYGQSKLGKTSAMLMAPPELFRPMAIWDADNGGALRMRAMSMSKEEREQKGIIMPPALETAGPWCAKDVDFFYPENGKPYYSEFLEWAQVAVPDYKLAVVDTGTRSAENIIDEVKQLGYGGEKRFKVGDTVAPNRSDYMLAAQRFMSILKVLDDSPAHVIVLCHERTTEIKISENDDTGRIIAGPKTVGRALVEELPTHVDILLRLEGRSELRGGAMSQKVLLRSVMHNNIYLAGERSGMFKDGEVFEPVKMWERFSAILDIAREDT